MQYMTDMIYMMYEYIYDHDAKDHELRQLGT